MEYQGDGAAWRLRKPVNEKSVCVQSVGLLFLFDAHIQNAVYAIWASVQLWAGLGMGFSSSPRDAFAALCLGTIRGPGSARFNEVTILLYTHTASIYRVVRNGDLGPHIR